MEAGIIADPMAEMDPAMDAGAEGGGAPAAEVAPNEESAINSSDSRRAEF